MSDSTINATDQKVLMTRVLDAPRDRVFRAWTDPEEVAAWYGPEHMHAPRDRIRIDLRVGGRWELTMVQRDGGGGEFSIGSCVVLLAFEHGTPGCLICPREPHLDENLDGSTRRE